MAATAIMKILALSASGNSKHAPVVCVSISTSFTPPDPDGFPYDLSFRVSRSLRGQQRERGFAGNVCVFRRVAMCAMKIELEVVVNTSAGKCRLGVRSLDFPAFLDFPALLDSETTRKPCC